MQVDVIEQVDGAVEPVFAGRHDDIAAVRGVAGLDGGLESGQRIVVGPGDRPESGDHKVGIGKCRWMDA